MTRRIDRGRLGVPSLGGLLGLTIVGVNLLIVLGATNALADAASACSDWPICGDPDLGDVGVWLAVAHRGAVVAVTGVLAATGVRAIRGEVGSRVRAAIAVAAALWPVQVGIGAVAATGGVPPAVAGAHLLAAVAILLALVAALAWHLQATSSADDLAGRRGRPERTPSPDGVRAYVALMKPRLMWLLSLVAIAAMVLAAGGLPDGEVVLGTLLGGVLAIGASGTFNHVLERDRDRRMARTADRPVAGGEVVPGRAIAFGLALTLASLVTFLTLTNVLAAALGMVAIGFYSVGYTLVLKPRTTQNVVIGGAVGAFPALIGWAAVTGSIGLPAVVLGGVIFLWTPAHFYNLALAHVEDYRAAGFPMVPVVHGTAVTLRDIVWYLGGTLVATATLVSISSLSWVAVLPTAVVGAGFIWAVLRVHERRTRAAAMRAFYASNAYLALVLIAIVLDGVV